MTEDLKVNRSLTIPGDEIRFTFTTSSGPGGQHANRSSTRAVVEWNVDTSRALGTRQRRLLRRALKNRIDSSGTLRVASDRHRSQFRNRRDALERLRMLIEQALRPRTPRVATAPTKASQDRRLRDKRHRGEIKRLRRGSSDD